jgi:hypothetical protein
MSTPQLDELNEGFVKAMAAAVLGKRLWTGESRIRTLEELSGYLLADLQDKAQLEATKVSSTVRTLQQFVHSVFGGTEPGFTNVYFEPDDRLYWDQYLSRYSRWSANQELMTHASNYIDPTLRLNKTALFRTFEGNLQQRRLSNASVKTALMGYTRGLQEISDLDVLAGYIDGKNTRQADYYLIGQEQTPPFAYHLRSVKVHVDVNSITIGPHNWSEWRKCDIVTSGKVVDIRCVIWLGRPVLVWCEWVERQVDTNGVVQSPWKLQIQLAFSSLNDQWSAPLTLWRQECEHDVSNGRLIAFSQGDGDPRDDLLSVCYTNRQDLGGKAPLHEIEIHETRDARMNKVPGDIDTQLQMVFGRFNNPASLQQKVVPADYSPITVRTQDIVAGPVSESLYLDAVYTREQWTDGKFYEVLRVRGRCDAVQERGRELQQLSIGWRAIHGTTYTDVEIVGVGGQQVSITLTTGRQPTDIHLVQLPEGAGKQDVHSFAINDFEEATVGDGIWVAKAEVDLSTAALSYLLEATPEQIRGGAGFTVDVLGVTVSNDKNLLVPRILYVPAQFEFGMDARLADDPPNWHSIADLRGDYSTPWLVFKRDTSSNSVNYFPIDAEIPFTFGAVQGKKRFFLKLNKRPSQYQTPFIDKVSSKGSQFLSFNNAEQKLKYARLNSEFGAVLTSLAAVSVEALLHWTTQHIQEKKLPDDTLEPNGPFDGCNGRYFWELFYHCVHLVARRFSEAGSYGEARQWFEFIFDPLSPEIPPDPRNRDVIPRDAYWLCRPLKIDAVNCSYENPAPTDPDAIGYCAPIHHMIAIFLHYVENLIAEGDDLYRQLDYDSMVRASLLYSKAQMLIGEEPVPQTASIWTPVTLSQLVTKIQGRESLKTFEARLEVGLGDVPLSMQGQPRLGLLGTSVFKDGINDRPNRLWTLLNSRLKNLRENRSIDGQPLSIRLFALPMDARELLIAQGNGTLGSSRDPGGQLKVVPYKWQTAFNLAMQLADFMIQQEELLRSWMELRDRGEQEELQYRHVIELADYNRSIQVATIAQQELIAESLRQSESLVQAQVQRFEALIKKGVSEAENRVLEKNRDARDVSVSAGVLQTIGAGLDLIPNIYGMAAGGMRPAAVPYAGAELLQLIAQFWRSEAEESSINAGHQRREEEWIFMLEQAKAEARVLREQYQAQEQAIIAARATLQLTEVVNTQSMEMFAFYKRRSTNQELSNWVVGQLKSLLFQLYDLVVSHCVIAQRCLQYEMGDFTMQFIRHDVWYDARHGFNAGASLKMNLLQMAAARLKRDERRLQLEKTISLKELVIEEEWNDFKTSGELRFKLNEELFAQDYPSHYCRQILELRCTCPGLLGPYQNIRATLVQLGSSIVVEPNIAAVKSLFEGVASTDSGSLVENLRPHQQIVLSRGLDENGIAERGGDDRYLPYEGTGCHSSWQLTFPRAAQPGQASLLRSLTDIIVTITYQARDGGPDFAREVEVLLSGSPATGRSSASGRARRMPS